MIGPDLERYVRQLIREEVRGVLAELAGAAAGGTRHVSVQAYAAARSISVSTVRKAVSAGRLPVVRIGRSVRVPADVEITSTRAPRETAGARAARRLGLVRGGKP